MVIWILNFGEGSLAVNYLIFATAASLGVLQFVAGRGRLVGLMLFPAKVSEWLGLALLAGAYVWFFSVQPDLFIPGLAGGELFILFLGGFVTAVLVSIGLGIAANRFVYRAPFRSPHHREYVTLTGSQKGELWLTEGAGPPLVIALSESNTDSLDFLGSELVGGGAAVLLCNETTAEEAVHFVESNADRFHPTRRYAVGVGRGADRVLKLAGKDMFCMVIALAPFGREENARPGLRWLGETDYLESLVAVSRRDEINSSIVSDNTSIIYGDEDTLIPPAVARQMHPSALMVAGARHFTLARTAATVRLALDLFELRGAAATPPEQVTASTSPLRGGPGN